MVVRIIVAFMLCFSCFAGDYSKIQPELLPYVKRAEFLLGEDYSGVEFVLINRDILRAPDIRGLCNPVTQKMWYRKKDFDRDDHTGRLLVVIHEIGHCIHRLKHQVGMDHFGCPVSIMYPSTSYVKRCLLRIGFNTYLYQFMLSIKTGPKFTEREIRNYNINADGGSCYVKTK